MRADPDLAYFFSQHVVSRIIRSIAIHLILCLGEHVSLDGQRSLGFGFPCGMLTFVRYLT